MENVIAKPQLGSVEALKLAWSHLFDFQGRSRRSEFWWFILVVWLVNFFVGLLLTAFPFVNTFVTILITVCAIAATVRRLHDTGHGGWWVWVSFLAGAFIQLYVVFGGVSQALWDIKGDVGAALDIIVSPLFLIPELIWLVSSIVVLVFCCLDSKPEPNKYGESPKYVPAEDPSETTVEVTE